MIDHLLKKIFRATSIMMLSISLFLCLFAGNTSANALVKGWQPVVDETLSQEDQGNNSLGIKIKPTEENINQEHLDAMEETKTTEYPDLGSDQVFPFIAGLDSFK